MVWWTVLSFICVIALKVFGEWRIKGLKAKQRQQAPELGKLRSRFKKMTKRTRELSGEKEALEKRMGFLRDAIQNLEKTLQNSDVDLTEERLQAIQAGELEEENSQT